MKQEQLCLIQLTECLDKNITDWSKIKNIIKDDLSEYLWKKIKRNPVILPIIMEAQVYNVAGYYADVLCVELMHLRRKSFTRFLIVKNTGNIEECRMRLTEYQILKRQIDEFRMKNFDAAELT